MTDFGPLTPPYDPVKYPPPPPWPLSADPRLPQCRHTWYGYWGKKGERQRQCRHCERFVWESQITPQSVAEMEATASHNGHGPDGGHDDD